MIARLNLPPTYLQNVAAWVVRRRVRLTNALAALVVAEAVYFGLRPHDLFNAHDPWSVFGFGLVMAGLGLRSWAAGILRKTAELTTTGPYALIRNPLYVGSLLIALGFAILLNDWFVVAAIGGPLFAIYYVQVLHEERNLASLYGDRWHCYARHTSRFVPRRFPIAANLAAVWSWRQWAGSREYRAVLGVLAGFGALQVLASLA